MLPSLLLLMLICAPWHAAHAAHGGDKAAPAKGPVKLAAIFAKTGIAREFDAPLFKAARLAVETVNARGGVLGRKVVMVEFDNQGTPIGSKIAAKRAVRAKVAGVIGASWSSHSIAMAPVLQKAHIPMISPMSTNPSVTTLGEYIFRVCFTDTFQGQVMAHFAHSDLKAATAVVLTNLSEKYSVTLGTYFALTFSGEGGKVLWQGGYLGKSVDFSKVLQKVRELKPDVVFVPGYERDSGLLIKQAAAMGVKTVFLGGDAWDSRTAEVAGPAIEGSYYSTFWHPQVERAQSRKMVSAYQKRYGRIDSSGAPLTYDAVLLMIDAIARAGGTSGPKVRAALAATKGFVGATGRIRFDANGDPLNKPAVIMQRRNGAWVYVKTVTPTLINPPGHR